MFWLDIREVLNATTVTFNIQTSPTKDESLFQTIATYAATGATLQILKVLMASATTPLARYVRWQVTSASTPYDATFRILVAANSPGM